MSARATDGGPPIYTKTGDDGSTGLLFGGRVSKANPASAALDLARTSLRHT